MSSAGRSEDTQEFDVKELENTLGNTTQVILKQTPWKPYWKPGKRVDIQWHIWHPHCRSHLMKRKTFSPLSARIQRKCSIRELTCFASTQNQPWNTVNSVRYVEYVLHEACRPKLDKTGITLIDEIIIARALSPPRSLRHISPWNFCN